MINRFLILITLPFWLAGQACGTVLLEQKFAGPVSGNTIAYAIALPNDYKTSGIKYPVMYWLHAWGKERGVYYNNDIKYIWRQYQTALQENAELTKMIIVAADGHGNSSYVDYKNKEFLTETEIIKDLIPYIEANYPVVAGQKHRGVMGFSMGGGGAWQFGVKFPELFRFAISLDGPPGVDDWAALKKGASWVTAPLDPFERDENYWKDYSPTANATKNADKIRGNVFFQHYRSSKLWESLLTKWQNTLINLNIPFSYVDLKTVDDHRVELIMDMKRSEIFKLVSDQFAGAPTDDAPLVDIPDAKSPELPLQDVFKRPLVKVEVVQAANSRRSSDPQKNQAQGNQCDSVAFLPVNVTGAEGKQIEGWINRLNGLTKASLHDSRHAGCVIASLDEWARGGALLGEAVGKEGGMQRRFLLGSAASVYFKVLDGASPEQDARIKQWMLKVADVVKEYWSDESIKRNFHYAYSGMAVMQVGVITNTRENIEWGRKAFEHAMNDVSRDGYLPLELARGELATHYHHMAVQPLTYMAQLSKIVGENWWTNKKLQRLIAFSIDATNDPMIGKHLTGQTQVSPWGPGWGWIGLLSADDPRRTRTISTTGRIPAVFYPGDGKIPDVYYLGGDLESFRDLVEKRRGM